MEYIFSVVFVMAVPFMKFTGTNNIFLWLFHWGDNLLYYNERWTQAIDVIFDKGLVSSKTNVWFIG